MNFSNLLTLDCFCCDPLHYHWELIFTELSGLPLVGAGMRNGFWYFIRINPSAKRKSGLHLCGYGLWGTEIKMAWDWPFGQLLARQTRRSLCHDENSWWSERVPRGCKFA
jgi:hypothetical protein